MVPSETLWQNIYNMETDVFNVTDRKVIKKKKITKIKKLSILTNLQYSKAEIIPQMSKVHGTAVRPVHGTAFHRREF